MSRINFASRQDLPTPAKLILNEIERRVSPGHDLMHATDTIASWVSKAKRTVQSWLNWLIEHEWLERLSGKGCRSRHRFKLLWREPSDQTPELSFGAETGALKAPEPALCGDIPPDPPIGEHESTTKGVLIAEPEPAPSSLFGASPLESQTADVELATQEAAKVFGDKPEVAKSILKLVVQYGVPRFMAALAQGKKALKRSGFLKPGYLAVTLAAWSEGGAADFAVTGPREAPPDWTPEGKAELVKRRQEISRQIAMEMSGGRVVETDWYAENFE